LESYVLKLLEEKIFNAPALEQLCQRIQQWKDQPSVTARETTTQALAEVELALQNITDAIAKGLLSDVLVIRMHELEEKKKALQHQLRQEQAKQKRPAQVIDPASILSQYKEAKGELTSPMYKDFIRDYIQRIEVGRYAVSITLKTGLDILPAMDSTYEVRREEIYRLGKEG
jgi:site-specific DNA recombinase